MKPRKQTEQWKPCSIHPEYEVSSLGQIRRLTWCKRAPAGTLVLGARRADGYLQIFGFKGFHLKHRLIAHEFLGLAPKGMTVNHKNGIRDDNRVCNLEYLTLGDNTKHGMLRESPEQKAARAERARTALKIANKKNTDTNYAKQKYPRTEIHREHLRSLQLGKPAWWEAKGFSSIQEAMRAKKGLP